MRTFTSADTKNTPASYRQGSRAPVAITKYDRRVVVVLAVEVEEFERLRARKERTHSPKKKGKA
jgi:hypothetical protein